MSNKYYLTIDEMPIYNWFKCIDLKDYTFVLKTKKECVESELNECEGIFGELYLQYIDAFGISEQLADILSIQNEILSLKIERVITNDKTIDSFIELKELELKDKVSVKQTKTNLIKVSIEKYLGFRLNEKEVTVVEYYNYLEALKENGRATNKE
jgi:hypothetical protein